jgi:dephospho-CoA kinase
MLVGLTGGIGAGKSTVADLFSKLGAVVIRADDLARQVVENDTAGFNKVVARFGPQIVGTDGHLDRRKLSEIVFNDNKSLTDLEEIIHPLVRLKSTEIIEKQNPETIIINEIPLLIEKNMQAMFDFLVVVVSDHKNRVDRLTKRGMTLPQIEARIDKQVDDETRKSAADFLITNDGSIEHLEDDVKKIWETLIERNFKS